MNRVCLALLGVFISSFVFGQEIVKADIALIPQPVSLQVQPGHFQVAAGVVIAADQPETEAIARRVAMQVKAASGIILPLTKDMAAKNAIVFNITKNDKLPKEGYRMQINDTGVVIDAGDAAGIFYGVQTLLQLLPKEIESKTATWSVPMMLPAVIIEDYPRFGWRGLMLDVSRHFFTKEEVKQFIDEMVKYKFNLLHWHLTDDQGWRIEIKSLPRLTSVGAWRVEKTGSFGGMTDPLPGEPRNYGGFYTQDDIREVVAYAKERNVEIMPEIDVPGHSMAAIAAYPEMTCTPGNYVVNSGEKLMVWPGGGKHFYGLKDNALCPANEKVYEFLDKIFTEVARLFPFEYIHMGGDETARNFWEKSSAIKALMQREKLKTLDEVQSYFVKRVAKIIESKGKKMMGWDEILQGGLAPGAAVMSWRGMKGGIEAAKMGHEVVMTPTDFVYIDYMQGDAIIEPPVYATLRLKKTYQFEPVPDGVNPSLIKGGQANLWTEQIYNMRHAQYMTWPRSLAVAEILWSPKEKRNWNDFIRRVENQFDRYKIAGINYSPAIYDPVFKVTKKEGGKIVVSLETEMDGLDIHYSFDNSFPDNFYPKYVSPVTVPRDASLMRVVTYRNGKQAGRMISMPVSELTKRAK